MQLLHRCPVVCSGLTGGILFSALAVKGVGIVLRWYGKAVTAEGRSEGFPQTSLKKVPPVL